MRTWWCCGCCATGATSCPTRGRRGLTGCTRLFLELIPGGAAVKKSTAQYRELLAGVRPRDPVGATRRRLAADLLKDLVRLDAQLKALKAQLKEAVTARGSHLMDIHGIGPAGAARTLADVGDIARFPDRNHFASWTGTAPIDASSGEHTHHRLSRAGNRRRTTCCTSPASSNCAATPRAGPTTGASGRRPRPRWRPSAACVGACRTWCTASSSPTPQRNARSIRPMSRRAREGTRGRRCDPARPTKPRTSALRISHFPDPRPPRYARRSRPGRAPARQQPPHRDDTPEVSTCRAPPGERR